MGSGAEKQLLCWLSKDYRLGLVACSLYKPKPVISCIRKAHQSTGPRTDDSSESPLSHVPQSGLRASQS
jgi:hypothetical protein